MSVAIYIVCEREVEGTDTFVDGKALGHVDPDVLASIETRLGVTPMYDMISADPEEIGEFFEGVDDAEIPPETWYPASKGLETVRALRAHLAENPSGLGNAAAVIEDLDDFERLLRYLDANEVRFHFAMDF
ncbi:MAG: hypothetical protein QNJ00_15595 [Woeseiaceae bacterium]|nr:hypothetical protein [Woeseiaceae bacterium]